MRAEGEVPKSFEEIKSLPDAEWKEYLKTLSLNELLDLADEGIKSVAKAIDDLSESLEASFEKHLPNDEASRKVAENLITRVMQM